MTKEQWTELMNDTKLPWPVIIDDTLKQYFTDKVADEVFDQILDAAWYRHLALGHSSKNEKKPDRDDAVEILKNDPDVKAHVLITLGDDCNAMLNVAGTGKQLLCLLVSGAAQFIQNAGDDVPKKYKSRIISRFKDEFIEALNAVLEDDAILEDNDDD